MKIILERMKTHPEEFEMSDNPFALDSKWATLVHKYEEHLPEEDIKEFKEAIAEMRQEEFTSKVMEELLDPKPEEQLTLNPKLTANVTSSGGVTLNISSAKLQTQSQIEHMKAHIEALQVKDRSALVNKPHKTLFGKLWNYL